MYTIVEHWRDEVFYLNHSALSTLSFGSLDMAWATDDRQKAELMLYKVEHIKGGAESEYSIESI